MKLLNFQVLAKKINSVNKLGWIKKKMPDITQNHSFFMMLYGFLLLMSLVPYYKNGQIILGGEADYFLDFNSALSSGGSAWQSLGTGFISASLNSLGVNFYFLIFTQELLHKFELMNFILIFLIYFLPFYAMFKVAKELKLSPLISFIISIFYISNPFSFYYLMALNQSSTMALFVLPYFFWIILKYYHTNFKLFFYFGFISFIFAFTNNNPGLMVVYQISIVVSTIVISFYYDEKVNFTKIIRKYILIITSFVLFNIWWIANWVIVFNESKKILTTSFAFSVLQQNAVPLLMWRTFTFTAGVTTKYGRSEFFLNYYTNTLSYFIEIIPITIFLYYLIRYKSTKKYILFLIITIPLILFLMKGISPPLGDVYRYMILNIPGFVVFKTSEDKWGVLYLFIFTLLMAYMFIEFKKDKYYKIIICFFVIYLTFSYIPFITSNFIPDLKTAPGYYQSRNYIDKIEYQHLRDELNSDKIDYRVLSLPGSVNSQIMLHNKDDKYYTGWDPVLSNTNKPFIAPWDANNEAFNILYTHISSPNYTKILGIFNIKKVVINKDMILWFGFKQKENISELENIFDKSMVSKKDGSIIVYDNQNYFLPHIYPAIKPILISGSINDIFNIETSTNFAMDRHLIFNLGQTNKSQWAFLKKYELQETSTPNITFQKINSAKYRIKVENVTHPFFLVFSETYNPNWKAYIDTPFKFNEIIAEYNNTGVKEARHDTNLYELGDISYYFKIPLDNEKHFLVNGYANAWYIDNLGTYDITLYYWPQIIFYGGFVISLLTFFGSFGYLILNQKIKKV